MSNTNYIEILTNKVIEARGQLSEASQRYINNTDDDDLYSNCMNLSYIIEQRYFMNDSDDVDYNILLNMMHLMDLMFELLDDDNYDFDDYIIVIDED